MQVSAKKALQKKSVGQNTEKNKAKYNKVIHIFVRLKNKETLFMTFTEISVIKKLPQKSHF